MVLARETAGADQRQRTILFGCAIALSGPLSKEGHLAQEGYDFWARYVNAHGGLRVGPNTYTVAIRYLDDASVPAQTALETLRLITVEHARFILGPYGSGPTFSAAAVAERYGVPMVSSGGSAERAFSQGFRYLFGVQSPARKYFSGIIEFAVHSKPRPQTIAISSATDDFSREAQQGAVQSANDHGIRVVYAEQYAGDPASIDAAAAAITARHPDVVLNAGHVQDTIAMHRALHDRGADAQIYGYSVGPDTPDFRAALGAEAQGVLGGAQWSPAVSYVGDPGFYRTSAAYTAAFTREVGHVPDYHSAESTAAGIAFADALTAAGSLQRNSVRDALSRLNVMTFFGPLRFDERGVNMYKQMVVNQTRGSSLVTVYPYRLVSRAAVTPRTADIATQDFRIETDRTQSDLNDGSFSMPHHVAFIRGGTRIVGDSAKGNALTGMVTIAGHVVLHVSDSPSGRVPAARTGGDSATLQCDELEVDAKHGVYGATGNVVYIQGPRRATAQNGQLIEHAHALVLVGNVRFAAGGQTLTAQSVHYDTLTKEVVSSADP
jgi:branched-chain amino acid transport system substrate-binding protein